MNQKKTQHDVGKKRGAPAPRSVLKPVIAVVLLIAVALGVAAFLVQRHRGETPVSSPVSTPGLNSKPVITPKGWTKGNPAAKTVLVEFADFQCGACANASKVVAAVLKKHENDLRVIFKQYPMETIHRNALIAAQAAEAAGKQFKFWEMHDLLFHRQREWAEIPDAQTFFLNYAVELQLDLVKFRQDLWDGGIRDKIYREVLEGQLAAVNSTPTFFLNGARLPNAKSDAHFEEMIAEAIKTAK